MDKMKVLVLLTTVSFVVNANHRKFIFEKINLKNVLIGGYVIQSVTSSVSECSLFCIHTSSCTSFGFNTKYGNCYLYNYTINSGLNGTSLNNVVYYSRIYNINPILTKTNTPSSTTNLHPSTTTTTSLPSITTSVQTTVQLPLADRCAEATYTYISNISYCFQFYSAKANWSTAQSTCQTYGGRLTHMDPYTKFIYIRDTFLDPWIVPYGVGVYVGVYYNNDFGYWTFSNSTGLIPKYYWIGSAIPALRPGECGYFDINLYNMGIWTRSCAFTYPYICELI